MKIFSHISEFNEEGYKLLPSMLLLSNKLTLWSPSSIQMKKYNDEGISYITPNNILELIEKGQIQIIGRKNWIRDKKFRENHPWAFGKWDENFDGKIYDWAYEDENKSIEEKRVIIADDEKGYTWAEQFLGDNENRLKIQYLEERIKNNLLPKGTLERISGKDFQEKLTILIRDIYNHYAAKENAGANASIEPDKWADIIYSTLNINSEIHKPLTEIEPEKIYDIIEELSRFDFCKDFESFKKVLKYQERVKSEIIEIANSGKSIKDVMMQATLKGVKTPKWVEVLKPNSDDFISISSIICSIITFDFSTSGIASIFLLLAGITKEAFSEDTFAKRVLKRTSLIKVKPSQEALPFILALGRENHTHEEAKRIHQIIKNK